MKKTKATVFSAGHSNVSLDTFLKKLLDNKIDTIVDVRSVPMSRFCPHFSKNALQSELAKRDIQYLWRGQNLGGRGINVSYEEAIDELVGMVKKGRNVAVLCSEGDYRKCHRYTTLTPSFEKRGLKVNHIQYDTKNETKTAKRNK